MVRSTSVYAWRDCFRGVKPQVGVHAMVFFFLLFFFFFSFQPHCTFHPSHTKSCTVLYK